MLDCLDTESLFLSLCKLERENPPLLLTLLGQSKDK